MAESPESSASRRAKVRPDAGGSHRLFCGSATTLRVAREQSTTVRLASVRPHGARLLVRFEGVDDAGAAAEFAGALLYAPRTSLEVAAGEYLDADLVGCAVHGGDGTHYGDGRARRALSSERHAGRRRRNDADGQRDRHQHRPRTQKQITIDPPEGLMRLAASRFAGGPLRTPLTAASTAFLIEEPVAVW